MQSPAGYSSLRRVGDFKHSARPADHDGWILCDGRTIKRTSYPKLFQALEISAATLTLPDARDCLLLGAGGRLKVFERGGANEITLTLAQIPAHDHGYSDSTATATTGKASVLTSLLPVLSGLTASDATRKTGKSGGGEPVKLQPLAIGANVFIYSGEAVV